MALSGWCSAPPSIRPKHEGCRWDLCGCDCHSDLRKRGAEGSDQGPFYGTMDSNEAGSAPTDHRPLDQQSYARGSASRG